MTESNQAGIYSKYFPNLSPTQLTKFNDLKHILLDWNNKINVISRKNTDALEVEHILHSLSVAKFVQFLPGSSILDFGTGGGFPGIPLAIMFPDVKFTLVDSISKKIKVVQSIADQLELKNVVARAERVENIPGQFDFITCRAVGRLSIIVPWLRGKIKKDSKHEIKNGYIFLKGGDLDEEIAEVRMPSKRIILSSYFEEPFFSTKEIVYLPTNNKTKKQ